MNASLSRDFRPLVFSVVATCLTFTLQAFADTYKDKVADNILKATNGDAEAQVWSASLFFRAGDDYATAAEWFGKAAAQGNVDGQKAIAWCYYLGAGVPRDYIAAVSVIPRPAGSADKFIGLEWFTKENWPEEQLGMLDDVYWESAMKEVDPSGTGPIEVSGGFRGDEPLPASLDRVTDITTRAQNGDPAAQYLMAQLCFRGFGVPQDATKGIEWLGKSQAQGNVQAFLALAILYADGRSVERNYDFAQRWFSYAADQGNTWAQLGLSAMYRDGNGVPKDTAKAVELMTKSAAQGNTMAMAVLGEYYRTGEVVSQDNAKAKELLEQAAVLRNQHALASLQEMDPSITAEFIQKIRSLESLELRANHGDEESQLVLGEAYRTPGDFYAPKKAIYYYSIAADHGNADAQLALGQMYLTGDGVPKDYSKAAERITKVAESGNTAAEVQLGDMYQAGQGVSKDPVMAYMWFNLAAAAGSGDGRTKRDALEGSMSSEQVTQAQKASSTWIENHRKSSH